MEVKAMKATRKVGIDIGLAADTTELSVIFTTNPNIYIIGIFARVKTAFAGVTSPTVKMGIRDITDLYIASQDIAKVGDLYTRNTLAYEPDRAVNMEHPSGNTYSYMRGVLCTANVSYQKAPASIEMVATFDSSAGNMTSLTAGEIEFVVVYAE